MINIDELKQILKKKNDELNGLRDSLNISLIKDNIDSLEKITAEADFWNDTDRAQKILAEIKGYKVKFDGFMNVKIKFDDMQTIIELLEMGDDAEMLSELEEKYNAFLNDMEDLTITTLLSGKYDTSNAIVTLHSGAGGTEACDWNEMLLRMYLRWCEKSGFKVEILDQLDGDEAGIKSVTFRVIGDNAFGYLKCEKGVHRLVRISPFDSNKRRHTSFASCDVLPEIEDDIDVVIKDEDLRIDTYRSGGAGGQHVNTTDSAIRITHIPTGTVVQCQNERSQIQNREMCMKVLRAKLYELEIEKQKANIKDIQGDLNEIGWGSQIRSYVFHPYNLVKDHRTGEEAGNINAVMDGDITKFINAYLKKIIG